MALTAIEIMALIVVVISAVKIVIILFNPRVWYNSVVKKVYAIPILTSIVTLISAVFALNYLLASGITIVQIFAVMLFWMFVMALSFAVYSKEVLIWADKMLRDHKFIKKSWLPLLVWIVLIIWALYALFA